MSEEAHISECNINLYFLCPMLETYFEQAHIVHVANYIYITLY